MPIMQCLVSVFPLSIRVHGFPRRSSGTSEKNFFGVYKDFGQFTGENWSSVQGYVQIGCQVWQRRKFSIGKGLEPLVLPLVPHLF